MNAPAYRAEVTRYGNRTDAVSIEDVCDADRATKARDQYAGGVLRAHTRVRLTEMCKR